jgi:catechol 2,3-dioxygenase-like lactoylglutathione lyase family enzyme
MAAIKGSEPLDMKLEVVVIGVSDVDRAKAFYEKLGWRLDADFAKSDEFRVIQFTPHNSQMLSLVTSLSCTQTLKGQESMTPGRLFRFATRRSKFCAGNPTAAGS